MREMFKPSMAELGLVMYQLEMCVQVNFTRHFAHCMLESNLVGDD